MFDSSFSFIINLAPVQRTLFQLFCINEQIKEILSWLGSIIRAAYIKFNFSLHLLLIEHDLNAHYCFSILMADSQRRP